MCKLVRGEGTKLPNDNACRAKTSFGGNSEILILAISLVLEGKQNYKNGCIDLDED